VRSDNYCVPFCNKPLCAVVAFGLLEPLVVCSSTIFFSCTQARFLAYVSRKVCIIT
jgi:hypothetical protein